MVMIMYLLPKNTNFNNLFTWMVDIVMAMITSIHQTRKNYMVLFIKIRDTVMVMIPKGQLLKNHLPFQSCQEDNINISLNILWICLTKETKRLNLSTKQLPVIIIL